MFIRLIISPGTGRRCLYLVSEGKPSDSIEKSHLAAHLFCMLLLQGTHAHHVCTRPTHAV